MSGSVIIVLSVLSILMLSSIIILILHIIRFRKYEKKYNNVWSKFENENFEKDVEYLIQSMNDTRRVSEEARISAESIEGKMLKSLQKVGFLKYDAYEGGNSGLSFTLAILNANDDGILINSVYTRNGSNIYAKQIINGSYEGSLAKEEQNALQKAINSKTFM